MTLRPRTGPIGRLVRLGWTIVFAFTLASIVDVRGPARFRDPHILGEPSAWIVLTRVGIGPPPDTGMVACVVGLSQIDRWEAARRAPIRAPDDGRVNERPRRSSR